MTQLVRWHCPVYGTIRINGKGIIKEGNPSGHSVNICACGLIFLKDLWNKSFFVHLGFGIRL